MVEPLRLPRGGFLRPFGYGPFIKEFLLGHGTEGAPRIDPDQGAAIDDIGYAYKSALLRAYAEDMVALAMEKGIELSVEEALERIPHRLPKCGHILSTDTSTISRCWSGWKQLVRKKNGGMGGTPGALIQKADKGTLVAVPQPRRFYWLTAKEKAASDMEWQDPL